MEKIDTFENYMHNTIKWIPDNRSSGCSCRRINQDWIQISEKGRSKFLVHSEITHSAELICRDFCFRKQSQKRYHYFPVIDPIRWLHMDD
ncbi:unnamed protein product [Hermetia illucens]|uniref:Uncharacterized protein n=1 Tax=Hermetia illucens TaxID=343691 RepID=A0A7R8Z1Y4_HERIL|nr:unnamed protein product [Hermetia illucens]